MNKESAVFWNSYYVYMYLEPLSQLFNLSIQKKYVFNFCARYLSTCFSSIHSAKLPKLNALIKKLQNCRKIVRYEL